MLIADDRRSLFTAAVNESSKARGGQPIRLAVDATRFHYFDRETGENLALRALATA